MAWVFTRNAGVWTHQDKLVGTRGREPPIGVSVLLSSNGITAMVGGYADNKYIGRSWVYVATAMPPSPFPSPARLLLPLLLLLVTERTFFSRSSVLHGPDNGPSTYFVTEHRPSAAVRTDRRSTSGKAFPGKDDPHARLTHAELLARALKLANDKPRALGRILKKR